MPPTKRRRRTKTAYAHLYDHPTALFGNGPDNPGVETILFPNGERELWLKDPRGHGVRITASAGPHGMGIRITCHVGASPMAVRTNDALANRWPHEASEVELTIYNATEEARAFSRWYDNQETEADIALLGPRYRRYRPEETH